MRFSISNTRWIAPLAALLLLRPQCAALGEEGTSSQSPILSTQPSAVPTLTVSGHGEVNARPDKATVRMGVEEQAETATRAQQEVNASMQEVMKRIRQAGVPRRSIQTTRLSLEPIYAQQKPSREPTLPRVTGYRASNTIQVEVTELEMLGQVIDAATAGGANRLGGVSFGLENDSGAQARALRLAAEDGAAKAKALAPALRVKLVAVQSVKQVSVNLPRPVYSGFAGVALARTPVEPGQMKIQASVTVEYRIEPAGKRSQSGDPDY